MQILLMDYRYYCYRTKDVGNWLVQTVAAACKKHLLFAIPILKIWIYILGRERSHIIYRQFTF